MQTDELTKHRFDSIEKSLAHQGELLAKVSESLIVLAELEVRHEHTTQALLHLQNQFVKNSESVRAIELQIAPLQQLHASVRKLTTAVFVGLSAGVLKFVYPMFGGGG